LLPPPEVLAGKLHRRRARTRPEPTGTARRVTPLESSLQRLLRRGFRGPSASAFGRRFSTWVVFPAPGSSLFMRNAYSSGERVPTVPISTTECARPRVSCGPSGATLPSDPARTYRQRRLPSRQSCLCTPDIHCFCSLEIPVCDLCHAGCQFGELDRGSGVVAVHSHSPWVQGALLVDHVGGRVARHSGHRRSPCVLRFVQADRPLRNPRHRGVTGGDRGDSGPREARIDWTGCRLAQGRRGERRGAF